ncbi:unnamed protein product [Linum tenue]|uniref:Uncharacterized protein n=1 Tax=Linum tenue TaxID=586396 RepID=A0AAV0PS96_9ROSI|nr:unnamed protein product [Linum tenue]CAI0474024.1 unnamed protein product [Linum tenue]CAI0627307.1 unnamed protein product [Linum tenue]
MLHGMLQVLCNSSPYIYSPYDTLVAQLGVTCNPPPHFYFTFILTFMYIDCKNVEVM